MSTDYEKAVDAAEKALAASGVPDAKRTAAIAVSAYLDHLRANAQAKPRFSEGRPGGLGDPMFEPRRSPVPVLQEWVQHLPLMQQTVLLTAIRGPDGVVKYSPVKPLLRWYRRCILLSAMDRAVLLNPTDPRGGSFTGPSIVLKDAPGWQRAMDNVVDGYVEGLDAMPLHFHLHLMHGAQVIGYRHPDDEIRAWWRANVYDRFVNHLHLHPEGDLEMHERLSDNRAVWLARNDPATTA